MNSQSVDEVNNQYHEELLKNQEIENIVENTSELDEKSFSHEALESPETEKDDFNDLKEFGVDTNEPDLFSHNNENLESQDHLNSSEDNNEEDDLEIPAFLRRQKN
jgi:cell division protein FtsZ